MLRGPVDAGCAGRELTGEFCEPDGRDA